MYPNTSSGPESEAKREDVVTLWTYDPVVDVSAMLTRRGAVSRFDIETDQDSIPVETRTLTSFDGESTPNHRRITAQLTNAGGWRALTVEAQIPVSSKGLDGRLSVEWKGRDSLSDRDVFFHFTDDDGKSVSLYGQTPSLMAGIGWTHIYTQEKRRPIKAGDELLIATAAARIAGMTAELEAGSAHSFWQKMLERVA